jgi:hypothetical protein
LLNEASTGPSAVSSRQAHRSRALSTRLCADPGTIRTLNSFTTGSTATYRAAAQVSQNAHEAATPTDIQRWRRTRRRHDHERQPDLGEVREELEAKYNADPIAIGFNRRYVVEPLIQMTSDQAAVALGGELDPGADPVAGQR